MKRMHFFLFLAITMISSSCMQLQRQSCHDYCDYNDYNDYDAISLDPMPIDTNNAYLPKQSMYTEAQQTGWQYLNHIMNMTYKRDTPTMTSATDLQPVYRSVSTNSTASTKKSQKKEKKTFLRAFTPLQPDADLVKKLHADAYDCFESPFPSRALALLINNMKLAKEKNITEDIMGKFSIDKWWAPDVYAIAPTALLFSCLKQYALMPQQTNELTFKKALTETLGIVTNVIPQEISPYLENALSILKEKKYFFFIETLADGLYKDKTVLLIEPLIDSSKINYTNLTREYYRLASHMFISKSYTTELSQLLQIINNAKTMHDITKETQLGYAILDFEPYFIDKISHYFESQSHYSIADIKKRVSLLCSLIEKYNQTRGNKITPMNDQYHCYTLQKKLNLAFPDSFDSTLFDENLYAFAEFNQLITDINSLLNAEDVEIQTCVNHCYPLRNII